MSDLHAAAELAKITMRGIRPHQFGEMTTEEKDYGCDLVVEYTKAAKFEKGVEVLRESIRFNSKALAAHARDVLRHGSADLGPDVERTIPRNREPAFIVDL